MPRYIDADALENRLKDFSEWCRDLRKQGVDFVLDCTLPNTVVADVVPRIELDAMRSAANSYKAHYELQKILYDNLCADVRENAISNICDICKYTDEHPDCPMDCMKCDLTERCHCHECINRCGWVWRGEVDATDINDGHKITSEDRCIVCGEVVPEGRQVCKNCEDKQKG